MSRRKQARPSRHLDDEDGQPLGTPNEGAADGKSPNYSCRACRTDLGSAEALAVHRTLCVARNSDDSAAEDFDDEEESNNNTQNRVRSRRRRRKRENSANNSPPEGGDSLRSKRRSVEPDDSDAEDENEDELEEEEEDRMEESGKEMGLVPHFGSLPYLPKGGPGGNGGTPPSGSAANPGMNPLFPYAATLANANMTLDAMQNTKLAIAQFAANHASSAANSQNPAALQELAVLQSTLYALQQQHLLQLQLIQQLQQQLQISHPEGVDIAEQLRLMGFPSSLAKTTALIRPGDSSLSPSSHDSTPPPGSLRPPVKESKEREGDRSKDKTSVNLKANLPPQSELKIARVTKQEPPGSESPANPSKPSKSVSKSSGLIQVASFLNTPISSTGSSTTPSTAVTNSYNSNMILPGSSLADSILQDTEPPPAPGGPSTLEMLQRTAQQVLNNASQGLLANNLADELGFRSNGTGGGSGDGKKDGLFKHRCRYCGKVFSSDSALQIHIRSHTGERPYKCNVCGNRFTTKGNLKVHFQRHAARFPHVKMNPNPVPEHLDKFHPPLLAQLDMDENDMSPPPPPLAPPPPPNPVSVDPRLPHPGALFRANLGGSSGPNVQIPPFYRTPNRDIFPPRLPMLLPPPPPATGGTESRDAQQTDPENLSSKSTGSNDKSGTNLNNSQSSDEMNQPNKRIKVEMLDKDEDMDSDSDHPQEREEAELQNESADLDRHDGSSLPSRGNSPVDEISKAPADDDAIDDRMSDREEDGDTPENLSASKPPSESPVLTAPSVSPAGHLQLSLPPCSTASGMLPFMSHHFSPHLPPHMRFPMGFPMHGPLPPYGPGSQRENSSGHGNGNHQLSLHNQGPFMFPADIDPSKDPAIYTNLLPRPGSNDNAWESLIEVTKTSETSKLQQLVDNIENKIVDPNQCVVCHRVLSCKSALQMHYRTHTGERPFKCKICGRAFTTKGNLKTHMGVHRAKPPARMLHMCPVCHKKFTNGLILQQHIRLHTGEPTDLTPEQIQAAEVREFHPGFPAMLAGAAGFHPFLPHGHFSHMGMRFPPHALESYKPLNLCPNSDDDMTRGNSATPRAEREGKDDFEASGGSSSEPLSPGSSINSCNLMLEQARALRYAAKAASGGGGQNQDAPVDHAEDNRSLTGKSEPDNSSDYQTHIKQEPDYEELSHRMRDFDNNDCEDPNVKNPRSQCSSVESKSPGLPPSVESRNSRSKAMLTPLDLTPRGQAVASAASVTPPSLNSALSSLASSVYTTPSSFNPLNLPMNVPGRGNTTCNLCFKTFACHSALEIHYRSHTKERPFKCPVCDRGFSTKGNMKQHLMTHKHREGISDDKNSRESTDSKNSCFSPSKTEFLSIHEALKLSQNSKDRLTDEESPPKQNGTRPSWLNNVIPPTDHSSPSERDRPLDCRSSPEENRDKELTPNPSESKHLNSLTSLEHLANLAEHAMSGGHRTPIGLKVTADASWDDFHLRFDSNSGKSERPGSHPKRPSSGLPKHLCHVCHKNFSSSSALQIHTRTHTGDKPFVCTLCAKAFTTRGNLKVHMGTHVLNHGHSRRGRRMSLDFPTLALIRNNTMAHPPNTHPQDPILRLLPQLPKVPRSTIPLPEGILPMRSAFTRPPLRPELFFPYLLAQYPENLLPTQRTSPESEECNPMPSSDSHQREPPASDSPDSVSISSSPQGPRGRNHRDNGSTEDWLWRMHCPLSPTARPFAGAPSPPASHPGSLMERPIGAVRQGEDCSPPPTTTIVV